MGRTPTGRELKATGHGQDTLEVAESRHLTATTRCWTGSLRGRSEVGWLGFHSVYDFQPSPNLHSPRASTIPKPHILTLSAGVPWSGGCSSQHACPGLRASPGTPLPAHSPRCPSLRSHVLLRHRAEPGEARHQPRALQASAAWEGSPRGPGNSLRRSRTAYPRGPEGSKESSRFSVFS